MAEISLTMIVKDEEKTLERCLEGVRKVVDEIIIVDTGSTDKTKEIAARYTNNIFDFEWINDFSAARNFSRAKATKEFFFWLDGDDVIRPEELEKFSFIKATLDSGRYDVVEMFYNTVFDKEGNVITRVTRNRIFRGSLPFKWEGRVHEVVNIFVAPERVLHSDITIDHRREKPVDPGRNLEIYNAMFRDHAKFSSRDLFAYGRELYLNSRYDEAASYFLKLLDRSDAACEHKIESLILLSDCYLSRGEIGKQKEALFKTLEFDIPRAEFCCRIGKVFFDASDFEKALYWYDMAIKVRRPSCASIPEEQCWTYLPQYYLAKCYDALKDYKSALRHCDILCNYFPSDESYQKYREYLATMAK